MSKAVGSADIACLFVRCCSCSSFCLWTCWVAGLITERYLSSSFCSLCISSSFWSSSNSSSSMSASLWRSSSIFSCSAYWRSRKVPISVSGNERLPVSLSKGFQSSLYPRSSTRLLRNFIRHEQLQRMQPPSLLRWTPRRSPSQALVNLSEGMFGGCRDCLGEPIKRLSHNHAKFALSRSLSPTLPRQCDSGGPSSTQCVRLRPGESAWWEGRLQESVAQCSLPLQRKLRSSHLAWIMDSVRKPLFGEACHHTSVTHPEAAELQIDEQPSLNGSWRWWKLNEPGCQNKRVFYLLVKESCAACRIVLLVDMLILNIWI